jgi:hypothetical protein
LQSGVVPMGRRLRTPGSRRSTNTWIRRSPFPFGIADSKDKIPSPDGEPGLGFHNWSGASGPVVPRPDTDRRANWKHGYYSREAKVERSRVRAAILALRYLRMLGQ